MILGSVGCRLGVLAAASLLWAAAGAADAAQQGGTGGQGGTAPAPLHPALERLKSLEGDWSGPAVWDQGGKKGNVDFKVSYKVTAAGKTVVETMFPGTPGEMITVYYADGDDLVLVHYCTAGNQPRMKLKTGGDPGDLAFRCVGGDNMKERDSHMHSARIRFVDADRIACAWSSVKDGQVQWVAEADLTRQKSPGAAGGGA